MREKWIFGSDFDDTLYHHDGRGILDEDASAIKNFQKEGNLFGLITGRGPGMKQLVFDSVQGKVHFDFIVFANGTYAEDEEGKILLKNPVPDGFFNYAIDVAEKHDIPLVFHTDKQSSLIWPGHEGEQSDRHPGFTALDRKHIDELLREVPLEISLNYHFPDAEVADQLLLEYPGICAFKNANFTDYFSSQTDKGIGLLQMARLNDIPASHTAGMGDSYNDLAMIEKAAAGFTFPQSEEEVRQAADEIAENIAQAMEILKKKDQVILINR